MRPLSLRERVGAVWAGGAYARRDRVRPLSLRERVGVRVNQDEYMVER